MYGSHMYYKSTPMGMPPSQGEMGARLKIPQHNYHADFGEGMRPHDNGQMMGSRMHAQHEPYEQRRNFEPNHDQPVDNEAPRDSFQLQMSLQQ